MRALALAALLVLSSCYEPGGQCTADADCLQDQVCGPDALCVPGTRPPTGTPPTANPDPSYATARDIPLQIAAPGVLANDVPASGLTAAVVTGATYGQVFLAPDGSFTYAPILGYVGQDAFSYRAFDGVLVSDPATVTITVGP